MQLLSTRPTSLTNDKTEAGDGPGASGDEWWVNSLLVLSREWMGMDGNGWEWGLLGLLFIVMDWIISENSLRETHQ